VTGTDLNNGRNYDPTVIAIMTATAVWAAGQLTHDHEAAQQFAEIVLPVLLPPLLEKR
jgi:hypothetical protein